MKPLLGNQALDRFLSYKPELVLDIGSGPLWHAGIMRAAGLTVKTLDMNHEADIQCDYLTRHFNPGAFDGIWCCHVLEHQRNPGQWFDKMYYDLREGGMLAVTVPPAKDEIVGGHVSVWNEGLLLYHLILAGFDCSQARVGRYSYNISVIVQKRTVSLPVLKSDYGDIEALSDYFPVEAFHGCTIESVNW